MDATSPSTLVNPRANSPPAGPCWIAETDIRPSAVWKDHILNRLTAKVLTFRWPQEWSESPVQFTSKRRPPMFNAPLAHHERWYRLAATQVGVGLTPSA